MTRCAHLGKPCMPVVEQARYIDTLDIACRWCNATYTAGEKHRCNDQEPEPVEHWGPVKVGVVVVFGLAFIYTLGMVAGIGYQVPA